MAASITVDPASRTAASWASSLAALESRGVSDNDPRVIECHNALGYWRVRRVIDAERGQLAPEYVPALADMLRHAHPAVTA